MPPKNITSVIRKIHIPRVEASFCCACGFELFAQCEGFFVNATSCVSR